MYDQKGKETKIKKKAAKVVWYCYCNSVDLNGKFEDDPYEAELDGVYAECQDDEKGGNLVLDYAVRAQGQLPFELKQQVAKLSGKRYEQVFDAGCAPGRCR